MNSLLMGFAYIGAVIGAGFASGQEILQFFTIYGRKGLWGISLSTVFFMLYGWLIIELGRRSGATSYTHITRRVGKGWLAKALDISITLYLVCSMIAMGAGAGAVGYESLGLPEILGSALLLIAAALTVVMGLGAVIKAIGLIAPIMIVSVIVVSISSLVAVRGCLSTSISIIPPAVHSWVLAAFLYVSYNLLGAISVLAPMGTRVRSSGAVFVIAVVGGLGLGLGSLASHLALLTSQQPVESAVPLVTLARGLSPSFGQFYSIIIFTEIYTTAVASLYGLTSRLTRIPMGILLITGVSWLMSLFGFSEVVRTIYPLMGLMGFVLLISLTVKAVLAVFPEIRHR